MAKKLTSLRISQYTIEQIGLLCERLDANQSEMIALAVDRMYREEFPERPNPMSPEQMEEAMRRAKTKLRPQPTTE